MLTFQAQNLIFFFQCQIKSLNHTLGRIDGLIPFHLSSSLSLHLFELS